MGHSGVSLRVGGQDEVQGRSPCSFHSEIPCVWAAFLLLVVAFLYLVSSSRRRRRRLGIFLGRSGEDVSLGVEKCRGRRDCLPASLLG